MIQGFSGHVGGQAGDQRKDDAMNNALFCEYGYVLDMDSRELLFFADSKITLTGDKQYTPYREAARFSFYFVQASDADFMIEKMNQAADQENNKEPTCFNALERAKLQGVNAFAGERDKIVCSLDALIRRLESAKNRFLSSRLTGARRVSELS